MFKDLKRTIRAIKAVKLRQEFQAEQIYNDGFEMMNEMLHPAFQLLRIVKIEKLSHNVTLLRGVSARTEKQPTSGKLNIIRKTLAPFRAGQYIGVKVTIDGVQTGRAYSLVSSPNNLAYYEIAVKDLGSDGFVSSYLCNEVQVGDILEVTAPLGNFYYNQLFHGNKLVFIAGGCGVTPFISMLRDFYEKDSQLDINLIFGCLSKKDILFYDELQRMADEKSNIDFTLVLSEPEGDWTGKTGFITKDIIKEALGSFDDTMIYIVGPDLMREFMLQELAEFNLRSNRVIWEVAPPVSDITSSIGWPKDIDHEQTVKCTVNWVYLGQKYTKILNVKSAEPLLNSIERAKLDGVVVENACRAGECALCRTKLISGNVFVPPHVVIRETDRDWGFIHPCVSYPVEDIEIELFSKMH